MLGPSVFMMCCAAGAYHPCFLPPASCFLLPASFQFIITFILAPISSLNAFTSVSSNFW
jgi:hypothetical protein